MRGESSLIDGTGRSANRAEVTDRSALTVEAKPSPATTSIVNDTVGVTSQKLFSLDEFNANALQLQNQSGTNALYIRFGTTAATNTDWMIPPGGTYQLPGGVRWEGQVQAISAGAGTPVTAIIWRGEDED